MSIRKIFLNPGHAPEGIPDPGAINYANNECEAKIAKRIADRVQMYLERVGYEVYNFQWHNLAGEERNEPYCRKSICGECNNWGADLAISIHCNSFRDQSARGNETYYISEEGSKLAECVNSNISSYLQSKDPSFPDRGVKFYRYGFLVHTDCPSILVETAFISNERDFTLLKNNEDDFARAIAVGITDYVASKN